MNNHKFYLHCMAGADGVNAVDFEMADNLYQSVPLMGR
ncbi:MAG: hypothetical protein JWQ05_3396 [Methylobacterium sp.]|jgi:hypothetical protein|nr:hypothetical protein [Methylobacterium sp.]